MSVVAGSLSCRSPPKVENYDPNIATNVYDVDFSQLSKCIYS